MITHLCVFEHQKSEIVEAVECYGEADTTEAGTARDSLSTQTSTNEEEQRHRSWSQQSADDAESQYSVRRAGPRGKSRGS